MSERIHDDEPDTSESTVRALVEAECPQWARSPLEYLATSGTDNAMWRIRRGDEPDLVARLPRRPHAAARVPREIAVLGQLEDSPIRAIVDTPSVRHVGSPHDAFPHSWSVLEWIDGADAWSLRADLERRPVGAVADQLARAVAAVGAIEGVDGPPREPGARGGSLGPLLDKLNRWLDDPEWSAEELIDTASVRRLADEAREIVDEPVTTGFVHGDLIPGNLLFHGDRLTAIIDWGGAGYGDTAQDLAPAWSVLSEADRPAFREAVGADDSAWIRGRTFELEHAVGGVLYYVPKGHPLGDVMARTLDRLLASAV